jgi:hypothetical protein
LIGLGAGGGVALLAAIAVAAMIAFGGDDEGQQVAQKPADAQNQTEADAVEDNSLDEESLDGDLFTSSDTDDAATDAEMTPSEEETASDAADAPPADNEVAPAAATTVAADGGAGAAPATAENPAPAADAANVATADAAEPQPPAPSEEPAAAAPAPAEAPAAEPKTETVAAAAAAPEPAPPAPEKKPEPPKPAKQEPFKEFAKDAIALPPLESGADAASLQPVSLAVVHDDPEAGCFLRLVGGETAHRARNVFTLEPDAQGFRNRAWTAFVGKGDAQSGAATPIAKLHLNEQDQLMFQWTPEATKEDTANYLRNCALNISIGSASKDVALRETTIVEPLALFDKPMKKEQYALEYPPNPDQLQVQITKLEGPLPEHNLTPPPTVAAVDGKAQIAFGKPPHQILLLEVRSDFKSKLELSIAPYLKVNNNTVKFTPAAVQQAAAQFDGIYKQMQAAVTQAKGREKEQLEQVMPQQQELAAQFMTLAQQAPALKDGSRMHFRVYVTVGQKEVELMKTGDAPAAALPAPGEGGDVSKLPGIRPPKEE